MKRLKFSPVTKNDYEKNNKPQTNDDLIEAKIFTYNLQVENTLATMVRNGLLSIRIAFLFYMTPHVSPWIGKSNNVRGCHCYSLVCYNVCQKHYGN